MKTLFWDQTSRCKEMKRASLCLISCQAKHGCRWCLATLLGTLATLKKLKMCQAFDFSKPVDHGDVCQMKQWVKW